MIAVVVVRDEMDDMFCGKNHSDMSTFSWCGVALRKPRRFAKIYFRVSEATPNFDF
jgi:hypothetical protein